jgi:hypothetical protein
VQKPVTFLTALEDKRIDCSLGFCNPENNQYVWIQNQRVIFIPIDSTHIQQNVLKIESGLSFQGEIIVLLLEHVDIVAWKGS